MNDKPKQVAQGEIDVVERPTTGFIDFENMDLRTIRYWANAAIKDIQTELGFRNVRALKIAAIKCAVNQLARQSAELAAMQAERDELKKELEFTKNQSQHWEARFWGNHDAVDCAYCLEG